MKPKIVQFEITHDLSDPDFPEISEGVFRLEQVESPSRYGNTSCVRVCAFLSAGVKRKEDGKYVHIFSTRKDPRPFQKALDKMVKAVHEKNYDEMERSRSIMHDSHSVTENIDEAEILFDVLIRCDGTAQIDMFPDDIYEPKFLGDKHALLHISQIYEYAYDLVEKEFGGWVE